MSQLSVPESLLLLLHAFQPCFNRDSWQNFVTLTVGWITCQGRHSISRVIQAASGIWHSEKERHHSTLYRFLSRSAWCADAVGKVLFKLLTPLLPREIVVLVDDTLCHKGGPHIFGASMHYDASQSTYGCGTNEKRKGFFAFGHNWVVLALWVPLPWNLERGLAIPILFRLYRSKKRCPKREYRKRTDLAVDLVRLLADWLPANREAYVVGDSEYSCKTLVRELPAGIFFVGRMSMDAALFDKPGPYRGMGTKTRRKGERLPSPEKLAVLRSTPWKSLKVTIYGRAVTILTKTQTCLWYTVAGTRMVRMVVTRDPEGHVEDRSYFSTNENLSTAKLLILFARRWELEVAFRNSKQVLGLEDPQNGWWRRGHDSPKPKKKVGPNPKGHRGEKAIVHTLAVAFAAYALVVIWYSQNGDCQADVEQVRREVPWYQHKRTPSFMDMLGSTRREIWAERLSANPLFKRVRQNVRELLPRWLLAG